MDNKYRTEKAIGDWIINTLPLVDVGASTRAAVAEIENALGQLYNQAEAAADNAAMEQIVTAWARSQQMANDIHQMDAAITSAAPVMRELARQRRKTLEELNGLLTAIAVGDTSDPRLASIVEAAGEEVADYTDEVYYNEMYAALRQSVSDLTGIPVHDLRKFIAFLQGDAPALNSVQLGLFKSFVAALNVKEAAHV